MKSPAAEAFTLAFSQRLSAGLRHHGWGIKDLAQACGVSYACAWQWCNGNGLPRAQALACIAERTPLDVRWLLVGGPHSLVAKPCRTVEPQERRAG